MRMKVAKIWYLAYFSASACLYPFFPLIFRRHGLSEKQIGVIAASRPFLGLPAGSVWSSVADKWRLHRQILIITFIAGTITRLITVGQTTFHSALAMVLLSEAFSAPVTIIADAAVMAACSTLEEGSYSRQRMWGAVGWGVFSALAGFVIDAVGIGATVVLCGVLSLCTLIPTALLPLDALNAKLYAFKHMDSADSNTNHRSASRSSSRYTMYSESQLASSSSDSELQPLTHGSNGNDAYLAVEEGNTIEEEQNTELPSQVQPPQSVDLRKGMQRLLYNADALIFFAMAMLLGYAVGSIEGFLFLYLDDLGGSETLMGLTLTFTCIAESAVFYYAGSIIKHLGINRCFHLIFTAFLVRMLCYATLDRWWSVWLVLPVEFLHGLTFGLTWAVGTQYCSLISPPGLEATTQSLFQGLHFGAGHAVGGLVGGVLYHSIGPQLMYIVACSVLVVGWTLTSIARWMVHRHQ